MRPLIAICSVTALTAAAAAQGPVAIYSNVAGQANAGVPGVAGLQFSSFDRPVRSPDGSRWMLLARNNSGSTATDAMYLTGSGTAGVLRIREGITDLEAGRVAENMSERRVGILNDGRYAVTVNLTGATTDDSVAILGDGTGAHTISFREGQSIPALPGITWGTGITDPSLTTAGKIAVRATSLVGGTAATDSAYLRDDGAGSIARKGLTAPAGQAGAAQTISSFNVGSLFVTPDGASTMYNAALNGPSATNAVLVVNDTVRLQKGVAFGGFASPIANIIAQNMDSSGDWFARGENADDQPWVVRNGIVIARSGDPVPGGITGETWSSVPWNVNLGNTFGVHTGNNLGDFIVGGFTSNPDAARQYALVLNNSTVVLREGDAVDLNGDGLFNDDAFYDVTGLNAASLNNKVSNFVLTDDLWLYGSIDLRNSAGAAIGEAFVRIQVPAPAATAIITLAGLAALRRRR
ncbi:MAG: hypothetical protein SFZ24_07860 [Planctomycetota bacterium]|nr:hypothetical protein [Planctomycetota bacterium]